MISYRQQPGPLSESIIKDDGEKRNTGKINLSRFTVLNMLDLMKSMHILQRRWQNKTRKILLFRKNQKPPVRLQTALDGLINGIRVLMGI